ncbi:hypothetical protein [Streptomyces sp. NPDC048001]|uniref:hypothetical protein n=1 Tax=unclassified Streptomyces TaxID=2593676 RepID=UPI003711919A
MDALLTGCFDLVETSAFGGFAAKRDLLRDLASVKGRPLNDLQVAAGVIGGHALRLPSR